MLTKSVDIHFIILVIFLISVLVNVFFSPNIIRVYGFNGKK